MRESKERMENGLRAGQRAFALCKKRVKRRDERESGDKNECDER